MVVAQDDVTVESLIDIVFQFRLRTERPVKSPSVHVRITSIT